MDSDNDATTDVVTDLTRPVTADQSHPEIPILADEIHEKSKEDASENPIVQADVEEDHLDGNENESDDEDCFTPGLTETLDLDDEPIVALETAEDVALDIYGCH
ncbi:hypothetical protein K435DRAFT_873411 [Dendrothele bispora CBS 962.96]|uniref:Uncharacterized protein n=1 Tax=Dendrothele bispora (strain CBS 962.96) TaxID=1314807 RepID=A0A4S8KZ88_DENBC|nr:hypothetical protein K435DRAFT_873411 [Dendrothele bispora CBS 962.96]